MLIVWLPVCRLPPGPITLPLENLSRPVSTAFEVASITPSRVTWCACMSSGRSCTVRSWSSSPQMATLATPSTRSMRDTIVQYASIDMAI